MRFALVACALAALPCGCKGHSPNWVRVDMPLAGELYGPADHAAEGGHAIAFHSTYVHIVEAKGQAVVLRTFREDGRKEREETLLTLEDGIWSLDPERIASSLGEEALDWKAQADILELVKQIHEARNLTTLFVTHDLSALPTACDRMVLMKEGKIWGEGVPVKLLTDENLSQLYDMSISKVKRRRVENIPV